MRDEFVGKLLVEAWEIFIIKKDARKECLRL
jgi:hypothetical protein